MDAMNSVEINAWLVKEVLVHEASLRGYLSRFFKNVADIEDVVQETYARLLVLSTSGFATVSNARAFLFVSARNVAIDRIRRARVVTLDILAEMEAVDVLDQEPAIDEALNTRQELALLAEAIAALPDRCRDVLRLRKLYGMSQQAIAQRLGISESTVEKHVAYGVRLCADRMFAHRGESARRAGKFPPDLRTRKFNDS